MNQSLIKIYTDGSCTSPDPLKENTGAWVAIVLMNNEKIVLKEVVRHTTHNRMELLAVIRAIEYVKSKSGHPMTIYTDSQYVVHLRDRKEKIKVQKYQTKNGTPIQNADLVQTLIHQLDTFQLNFVKVKAHQKQGYSPNYNREADKLARKLVRDFIRSNQQY